MSVIHIGARWACFVWTLQELLLVDPQGMHGGSRGNTELQKTIKLNLSGLTATKEALFRREWETWQSHVRHEKAD